ncbi:helix-turn-helix domain-containing protein [Actinoalloteichus sp. AHMU CJ021]|uniref:Peptide deformylase n=1 Tax=Actinoalloteichus caeruleus DSM 43889 TaxID=1120930 RepID=A0ABT1JLY9_ACTCY|nr:peptide deformylase [Actinoalloteichus caeruleus]AUS79102.1 helix-turn-helix domain-containing protein [Actinoalloteichus sp. AHMU CJ021]MCP2333347.1 peptide deformylase [Actinoalloteichus caeruleus DSM 43889]
MPDQAQPGTDTRPEQAAFIAEFRRWRDVRGLSRAALAKAMDYSRSYVSKVESGGEQASREFARAADSALNAGGALRRAWREQQALRGGATRTPSPPPVPVIEPATGLLVEHDHAELRYEQGFYTATMRRKIVNTGDAPITRYLIRISVDRFPDDPRRSNDLYRDNPLDWEELGLRAWHGEGRHEPMRWSVQHDRDAFKEVWLQFANESGRFPLYPGQSTWIEYTYRVPDDKWGHWFRRAVRLPTHRLSISLDFPAALDPSVWGLHTSMTAESMPFQTAIDTHERDGRRIHSWSTDDPPLHARYRLEWHFRNDERRQPVPPKPSQIMASLGVVQEGDPVLRRPAREFDLPSEAADAQRVISELRLAGDRVVRAHTFGKGMGVAAPQLGIERAAAIIRPPGSSEPITLLNPRVIEASDDTDEQYEGCLSFFDVRSLVPRPLMIHVAHQDLNGERRITVFERGVARLVAHEIDHLDGVLCRDYLGERAQPIPVEQYRSSGQAWSYSSPQG